MKLNLVSIVLVLSWVTGTSTASAQLLAAREAPIAYGHHHLDVTSIAEQKKFFVDTLGGVPVTLARPRDHQVPERPRLPARAEADRRQSRNDGQSYRFHGTQSPADARQAEGKRLPDRDA